MFFISFNSLSNTEDKLNELCKRENKDVNEFKKLLKENKQILEEKEVRWIVGLFELEASTSIHLTIRSSLFVHHDTVSNCNLCLCLIAIIGCTRNASNINCIPQFGTGGGQCDFRKGIRPIHNPSQGFARK